MHIPEPAPELVMAAFCKRARHRECEGLRCLMHRGARYFRSSERVSYLRLAKFVCTSSSQLRGLAALGLHTPVSQCFRIVGGANHGLPGNVLPHPHRDLAPGKVIYACTVASLAPLPCGSDVAARRLDHMICGDALRSLGATTQRLQQVSIRITAAARQSSGL